MQDSITKAKPRITTIINPNAANKKWKRNVLVRTYLQKHLPGDFVDTHKDKAFTVQTAKELCAHNDVIVAAGGDGTIADVIQGIIDSGRAEQVSLGILPLGSGNALRSSLGIPLNLPRAIKIINAGRIREIDVIDFNGHIATFGSIGATAEITTEKLQNKVPGFFGHILAARIMSKLSREEQEVELFGGIEDSGEPFQHKHMKLKVFDAVIGKTNHFGYGWKIAPEAEIDDGYIDITFFEISSSKFLLYFPSIYFGTFQKTQKHYKARKVILRGKKMPVQYNGESMGIKDKVELNILPRALKVIVP
ncbi:MAG: hypothetical protein GQ544_09175 [Candidatus Aminicenantes bacterium]|nr:hypothetical protein [Candidatus Aminicenantes bacterium]